MPRLGLEAIVSPRPRMTPEEFKSIFDIEVEPPPHVTKAEEEYSARFGGRPGIDNVQREAHVTENEARALRKENDGLKSRVAELEAQLAAKARPRAPGGKRDKEEPATPATMAAMDRAFFADEGLDETLYQAIKARLLREPKILQLLAVKPELRVAVERPVIDLEGDTLRGRLARLLADGFFKEPATGHRAFQEMERRAFRTSKPNVYKELDKLAELGFLTKEEGGYQAVDGMLVNVVSR